MARNSDGTFGSKRILFTRCSCALVAADLIHGEAEIGDHLFKGDASLGVLPKVLARGCNSATVFFAQGLVIWLGHDFEKLRNRGDLDGVELFQ